MTNLAMDPNDRKATVETAKGAIDNLPETGRAEVLEHLLSQLSPETLEALSPKTRSKLLADLQGYEARLEARKQAFLAAYSVKILDGGPHQVSFTIPEGRSPIDLINDAHELAETLYHLVGVQPNCLAKWRKDSEFTTVNTTPVVCAVEGRVPGSTSMNVTQQRSNGWNDVNLVDLACAHQAFLIATGRSLFDGKVVRAFRKALNFGGEWLKVYGFYSVSHNPYAFVAASRSLEEEDSD